MWALVAVPSSRRAHNDSRPTQLAYAASNSLSACTVAATHAAAGRWLTLLTDIAWAGALPMAHQTQRISRLAARHARGTRGIQRGTARRYIS
jgi:hypothetical protein